MAILKPKKPLTKTKLKEKCDRLASLYYRRETPYCEARGLGAYTWKTTPEGEELLYPLAIQCSDNLQWAHIYTRAILHIRYEKYNNLILCSGHHIFWTYHPIEWTRFLEAYYPDRLAEAEANRYKFWKVDYEYWINFFDYQLKN